MRQVIAEIGSVHDGSFGNACKLIELAAICGADTVKFQTHLPEAETLRDAPAPAYFTGEPRFDYFRRTGFTIDQWRALKAKCAEAGVTFLSSPFSLEAVDLLEEVGAAQYKIPSGEVTNIPLLERIAETGKPTLLSSGMSNWTELDRAVSVLRDKVSLAVMQCTSAYPCSAEDVGLNVLDEIRRRYKLVIGYSDHTDGAAAGMAAAALGADVIEKHLTFSRRMYGSDAANAMEPEHFRAYCAGIRNIWRMLDNPVDKNDLRSVLDMKRIFEKSVVSSRALPAGAVLVQEDLAFKKPGHGISAARYREVIGRRLRLEVAADHLFSEQDFA